jgi:hypothetical protein
LKDPALRGSSGPSHSSRPRRSPQAPSLPVDSLRWIFRERITALAVVELLDTCEASDPVRVVRRKMERKSFDVLGVRIAGGAPYGYVELESLQGGTASDSVVPFGAGTLISDSTPLLEVVEFLRDHPRVFVLRGQSVFGIITRADLQKSPVRVLVFGLLSSLEMQLSERLCHEYQESGWTGLLTKTRLAKARELFELRRSRNEEIDLFDCLQLCDKGTMVSKNTELRQGLGFTSKLRSEGFFKRVEALRNRVAHGQDLVSGANWPDLIDLLDEIDSALERLLD